MPCIFYLYHIIFRALAKKKFMIENVLNLDFYSNIAFSVDVASRGFVI